MRFRPYVAPSANAGVTREAGADGAPHSASNQAGGAGTRVKPLEHRLEPRSAYIIQGPARSQWQHSIPPTKTLRYSITFRTLRRAR